MSTSTSRRERKYFIQMNIALVNANRIRPPIAPIGLEYLAETLAAAGESVDILDLCWEEDVDAAIKNFFFAQSFDLVGLTLRNTDDCAFTSRQSFVGDFSDIVRNVKSGTDAMVVIGGVGFSTQPEAILSACPADAGICGDGEFAFLELARKIKAREDWRALPNLIFLNGNQWIRTSARTYPLEKLPVMKRNLLDNRRYFYEGGQAGFETKRGCPGKCIYCADPVAKGRKIRLRPPQHVADELESLLEQGIDHFHTCDSEFNLPASHAEDVCRVLIKQNLGDKIRWYAYCTPAGFSKDLAKCMHEAGCAGINFGVDSGDSRMLKLLKRNFSPDDIVNTAGFCRESGIAVMFDLLLGAPGETKHSITATLDLMKQANPDRVGVSMGVRIYPETELDAWVKSGKLSQGFYGGATALEPLFFIEPEVAPFISDLISQLTAKDPRFLFFNPDNPDQNYNYNANDVLVDAIKRGYRGAYWDILRRIGGNHE
jgi:tryptophan 2-C-methyltransferase